MIPKTLTPEEVERDVEAEFKINRGGFKLEVHHTETLGNHIVTTVPSANDTKRLRQAVIDARITLRASQQKNVGLLKDLETNANLLMHTMAVLSLYGGETGIENESMLDTLERIIREREGAKKENNMNAKGVIALGGLLYELRSQLRASQQEVERLKESLVDNIPVDAKDIVIQLESEVKRLKCEYNEEVDEFNTGHTAFTEGKSVDDEPSDLKHDVWRVGYAFAAFASLRSELEAYKKAVREAIDEISSEAGKEMSEGDYGYQKGLSFALRMIRATQRETDCIVLKSEAK